MALWEGPSSCRLPNPPVGPAQDPSHEKAAGLTALCKKMERVRLDTLLAEQERQTAAAKAATEKDKAWKDAKHIKRVTWKERKKVELAEMAAELAAGRAALVAIAEFEAVSKAATVIKE